MKLEISEAISIILGAAAHSSSTAEHRPIGDKALDLLKDYCVETPASTVASPGAQPAGQDPVACAQAIRAYNEAMVAAVLSAVRAFDVERGLFDEQRKLMKAELNRKSELYQMSTALSPISGSHWSKVISILGGAGVSYANSLAPGMQLFSGSTIVAFGIGFGLWLFGMEMLSRLLANKYTTAAEAKEFTESYHQWRESTLEHYGLIVKDFIDDAITFHQRYLPNEKINLCGVEIETNGDIKVPTNDPVGKLMDFGDLRKENTLEALKKYVISVKFYMDKYPKSIYANKAKS
jgi:hypothetical protein